MQNPNSPSWADRTLFSEFMSVDELTELGTGDVAYIKQIKARDLKEMFPDCPLVIGKLDRRNLIRNWSLALGAIVLYWIPASGDRAVGFRVVSVATESPLGRFPSGSGRCAHHGYLPGQSRATRFPGQNPDLDHHFILCDARRR